MSIPVKVYFDVENTLAVPFISGIQRVVKELSSRLIHDSGSGFKFIPVIFCGDCNSWRRLSEEELSNLVGRFKTPNSAEKVFFVDKLKFLPSGRIRSYLRKVYKSLGHPKWHAECVLPAFQAGSIFLDIDASWHNDLKRSRLLPALKHIGVRIVTLHYDLIPLVHPDMIPRKSRQLFVDHCHAHLRYSDLFICISKNSEADLGDYARQYDPKLKITTKTITLGSNISSEENESSDQTESTVSIPGKYILTVGTIEPRKNYQLLLDAYDRLSAQYPDLMLVVVGRKGWNADHIVNDIKQHKYYGKRLFWLTGLSDAELSEIYKRAFITVVPSYYEGYGLPVSEALQRGCIVISSNRGALIEAGGDFAEYFDPSSSSEVVKCISKYLDDDELYLAKKEQLKEYSPPSWSNTIDQLLGALSSINNH